MSRRRIPAGAAISLFPFLAVLLCTMGALLVLLVIFSRRARDSEAAAARAGEQARLEEIAAFRADLRQRREQLRLVREQMMADLARERMRLAGVEEDARKLVDELESLDRTATALEQAPADTGAEVLADAERRLAASRAALEEARVAGTTKPAAYAVVPYEGSEGTHRRPLYIECCIDGVFLQPEEIRLGPGDFEGPPGPGNPLASALRAAREHLARGPGESGDPSAQPYPLLLVRPSGVMAYYAAREALVSWGSEFGYQFVDEDWELRYPPADPGLAAVERRAIEEARRRIEWLAQVRPSRPARPTQQYRAATTRGGVVAQGGPSVLGDRSRFDWTEEQVTTDRRPGTGDGGGKAGADSGAADGTAPGAGDVVLGGGGTNAAAGSAYDGPSRFYAGQPPADATSTGGGPAGPGGSKAADGPAGGARTGNLHGPDGPGEVPAAAGVAAVPGGGPAADGTATGGGSSAAAPAASSSSAAGGGASGMGNAGGGPALPGMKQGGVPSVSVDGAAPASGSLAGARGSNWASLATADRPIPLTRPIRIECTADEFRFLDETGRRVETRVPIGTRTADAVDPLVQAVHGHVARWGLAGERMYWRPELVLSATPDGTARRDDLERLLADSGLDTRRVDTDPRVRLLPPVTRTTAASPRR